MELIKFLSDEVILDELREKFNGSKEGWLNIHEFLDAMETVFEEHASELDSVNLDEFSTTRLTELFEEIDFNGDNQLTWEEFTTYVIDDVMRGAMVDTFENRIKTYKLQDTQREPVANSVKKMTYLKSWDKLAKMYTFSPKAHRLVIVDSETLSPALTFPTVDQPLLAVEHIPIHNGLAIACGNRTVSFWDVGPNAKQRKQELRFNNKQNLYRMRNSAFGTGENQHRRRRIKATYHLSSMNKHQSYWDTTESPVSKFSTEALRGTHVIPEQQVNLLELAENQMSMKWYKSKHRLLAGSSEGRLNIIDVEEAFKEYSLSTEDSALLRPMLKGTIDKIHHKPIMAIEVAEQDVITCSMDSLIKLTSLDTGRSHTTLAGHDSAVMLLSYSTNHNLLISAGFEYDPFVWALHVKDFKPWRLHDQLNPHRSTIIGAYCVPNSPQVLTADRTGMVKLWDIRSFGCVDTVTEMMTSFQSPRLQLNQPTINSFAYIDTQHTVVCSGKETYAHKYDENMEPKHADDGPIHACLYNHHTSTFLTTQRNCVKIWDARDGTIKNVYSNLTEDEITAACICDRGRKFYLGTHKGQLKSVVYATGLVVKDYPPHDGEVTFLAYVRGTREFRCVITASWDGEVRVLSDVDYSDDQTWKALIRHTKGSEIRCAALSPCISMFAIATNHGHVACGDTEQWSFISNIGDDIEEAVTCLTFLGDYPAIAVADAGGFISVYTVRPFRQTRKLVVRWQYSARIPTTSNFDLKRMDSGSNLTSLGSFTKRKRKTSISLNSDTNAVPESPRSNRSGSPRSPRKRKMSLGLGSQKPRQHIVAEVVTSMAFHTSRDILYTGSDAGFVTKWNLSEVVFKTGLQPTVYPSKSFSAVAISLLSDELQACDPEKTVARMKHWKAHNDEIRNIQIVTATAIYVRIITSSYDGQILIWDTMGTPLGSFCQGREPVYIREGSTSPEAAAQQKNLPEFKFADATAAETDFSRGTRKVGRRLSAMHKRRATTAQTENHLTTADNRIFLTEVMQQEENKQQGQEKQSQDGTNPAATLSLRNRSASFAFPAGLSNPLLLRVSPRDSPSVDTESSSSGSRYNGKFSNNKIVDVRKLPKHGKFITDRKPTCLLPIQYKQFKTNAGSYNIHGYKPLPPHYKVMRESVRGINNTMSDIMNPMMVMRDADNHVTGDTSMPNKPSLMDDTNFRFSHMWDQDWLTGPIDEDDDLYMDSCNSNGIIVEHEGETPKVSAYTGVQAITGNLTQPLHVRYRLPSVVRSTEKLIEKRMKDTLTVEKGDDQEPSPRLLQNSYDKQLHVAQEEVLQDAEKPLSLFPTIKTDLAVKLIPSTSNSSVTAIPPPKRSALKPKVTVRPKKNWTAVVKFTPKPPNTPFSPPQRFVPD